MLLEMNIRLKRGHFDLSPQISLDDTSVGLFGKAGAGKSTFLNLLAGTIQPQKGHISLDGKVLFDGSKGIMVPREQRPIGAVLQLDSAYDTETVGINLGYAYERTLKKRRLFKLSYLIELLGLGAILEQRIDTLTVGERQRVAIVRALLKSPKLLLMDDTFATIGSDFRAPILPILNRLQDEFGLLFIYASQSLSEILELTDQFMVLDGGQVRRSGSLRDISKESGILSYLGIRNIDNILTVTIRQHSPEAGYTIADSFGLPLTLPLRSNLEPGSQTQVSIKANDIAISRFYVKGISIQNQIRGRICSLIRCGGSLVVQVDCGRTLLVEITPGACKDMDLREGDIIYCLIKTHAIAYVSELEALPFHRVVSHGNEYFYMKEVVKSNAFQELGFEKKSTEFY